MSLVRCHESKSILGSFQNFPIRVVRRVKPHGSIPLSISVDVPENLGASLFFIHWSWGISKFWIGWGSLCYFIECSGVEVDIATVEYFMVVVLKDGCIFFVIHS